MSQIIRAVRGASLQEPLTITDRDGAPTDLTGASLRWMAKRRVDDIDADAALTASSAAGSIVVVDAEAGQIRLSLPASQTDALYPWLVYVWTLEVESGGVVTRYPDHFQGGPGKLLVAASAITSLA